MGTAGKVISVRDIDKAIAKLKRSNTKLTVAKIAETAQIERKTIYNRPDLRERCTQAIELQKVRKDEQEGVAVPDDQHPLKKRNLTVQNKKLITENERLKMKYTKTLEQNRLMVLEIQDKQSQIDILQDEIRRLKEAKVVPFKR